MALGNADAVSVIRHLGLAVTLLPTVREAINLVIDPDLEASVRQVLQGLDSILIKLDADEALRKADVLEWSPELRIQLQSAAYDRLRQQLALLLGLTWHPPVILPPRVYTTQVVISRNTR